MMGAKERFISSTLREEGAKMYSLQSNAIRSGYKRRTGKLLSGRSIFTTEDSLTLEHPVYERFLDIKYRRRKAKRIHNRFVYGTVYAIAGRLSAGYREDVEEIVDDLRKNTSGN